MAPGWPRGLLPDVLPAEAEAKKNNWPVVITILDSGGNVVLVQRLDGAQFGSVEVSCD